MILWISELMLMALLVAAWMGALISTMAIMLVCSHVYKLLEYKLFTLSFVVFFHLQTSLLSCQNLCLLELSLHIVLQLYGLTKVTVNRSLEDSKRVEPLIITVLKLV